MYNVGHRNHALVLRRCGASDVSSTVPRLGLDERVDRGLELLDVAEQLAGGQVVAHL